MTPKDFREDLKNRTDKRKIIADIIYGHLYYPMLKEDDENWKRCRALKISDKILDLLRLAERDRLA